MQPGWKGRGTQTQKDLGRCTETGTITIPADSGLVSTSAMTSAAFGWSLGSCGPGGRGFRPPFSQTWPRDPSRNDEVRHSAENSAPSTAMSGRCSSTPGLQTPCQSLAKQTKHSPQLRTNLIMKNDFSGTQRSTILEWCLGTPGPSRPPKSMISGARKNNLSCLY